MPVFKIVDYRSGSDEGTVEFDVGFRDGEPVVGEEFFCYDTHHPVRYVVRGLRKQPTTTTLLCKGEFCYDDAFVDAVVDTTLRGRPSGFHYEGRMTAKRPNHTSEGI
jgi:hypothetical protein